MVGRAMAVGAVTAGIAIGAVNLTNASLVEGVGIGFIVGLIVVSVTSIRWPNKNGD